MMTSKDEAAFLKTLEPFIAKTTRRYFSSAEEREDAEQEARIEAVSAMRSWRAESGAKLTTHCLRNIWWRVHSVAVRARRVREHEVPAENLCAVGCEDQRRTGEETPFRASFADSSAVNAERALIVLELFNALSPEQQSAIERRATEVVRGQPTVHAQSARIAAAEFMQ